MESQLSSISCKTRRFLLEAFCYIHSCCSRDTGHGNHHRWGLPQATSDPPGEPAASALPAWPCHDSAFPTTFPCPASSVPPCSYHIYCEKAKRYFVIILKLWIRWLHTPSLLNYNLRARGHASERNTSASPSDSPPRGDRWRAQRHSLRRAGQHPAIPPPPRRCVPSAAAKPWPLQKKHSALHQHPDPGSINHFKPAGTGHKKCQ